MNYYDILLAKKLEDDRDPRVDGLSVTENGRYAEEGVVYSPVIVSVPEPTLTTKTITSNGTYSAAEDNADGYSEVNVDVPLPSNGYLLESASGELVTVSDAGVFPLVSCDVDIEPRQELHGYDNPWAGGVGKNKLPMTLETIKAINGSSTGTWSGNVFTHIYGVKFTVLTDEGGNVTGINANGTATAIAFFNVGVYTPTAGDILNGCPAGGGNSGPYKIMGSGATTSDTGNGIEIVNEVGEETTFRIVIWTGATVTNLKFYPMIRKSTEQSATFAPYTNICPISGYSEVSLNRTGKNIAPFVDNVVSSASNLTVTTTSDGGIHISGIPSVGYAGLTSVITTYIPSGTTITLSRSVAKNYRMYAHLTYADASTYDLSILDNRTSATMTLSKDVSSIKLYLSVMNTSTNYDETIYPQLEFGSSATTYEPYQGTAITLSLGSTVYGGSVDLTSGVLTVDRVGVTFDGSSDENWALYGSGSASAYAMKVLVSPMPEREYGKFSVISNYLKGLSPDTTWGNYPSFISTSESFNGIVAGINTITTVADWKTYLASNNLQVVYELATPQQIRLTPTLIKLLQGINNLYTDGCDIAIEYFGKGANL